MCQSIHSVWVGVLVISVGAPGSPDAGHLQERLAPASHSFCTANWQFMFSIDRRPREHKDIDQLSMEQRSVAQRVNELASITEGAEALLSSDMSHSSSSA